MKPKRHIDFTVKHLLLSDPERLVLVFTSILSNLDKVSVSVGVALTPTLLTPTPDEALRPAQVDSVPAGVLQGGQGDCIHPDRRRVSQRGRHDGAPQAPGLPVGGRSAHRNTLNEGPRVTDGGSL